MKNIKNIIESQTPPDKNTLWLDVSDGVKKLKWFIKGKWEVVNDNPEIVEEVVKAVMEKIDPELDSFVTKEDADAAYASKESLDGKVDKETGKQLSTNDYTTAEKQKLSTVEAYATADSALTTEEIEEILV